MHSGVEQTKADLEAAIEHNVEDASEANTTRKRDAATEIGTLRQEFIATFQELETAADLKKTEFQQWTAGFRIEVRGEFLRQGGAAE